MNTRLPILILMLGVSLGALPRAFAAEPKLPLPQGLLELEILPNDVPACTKWAQFQPEMAPLAAALLSTMLPKIVDAGVGSLSAALRAASGADAKTAQSSAIATTYAYDYDTANASRQWAASNACLVAKTPNANFRALFVVRHSPDRTALRLILMEMTYKDPLKKGRAVEGMTMSVIFKGVDDKEIAKTTFVGPFIPAEASFAASTDKPPITSGWLSLPPMSDPVKALVSQRDQWCTRRKDAANAFQSKAMEEAKAAKKTVSQTDLVVVAPGQPCGGIKVQDGLQITPAWSKLNEDSLVQLEKQLTRQEPISVELVVTETRSVNQFLFQVSEVLSKSKEGMTAAVVDYYDKDKQLVSAKAEDALTQDYDLELAKFQEKVRVYRQAIQTQDAAEARLATATLSGDPEAKEKAGKEAEAARVARAAAFEAALTARKTARAAALAAGVSLGAAHALSTFPD